MGGWAGLEGDTQNTFNTPQAVCIPCQESGAGRHNYAAGRGKFHYCNLKRHGNCPKHKEAVQIVQQRCKEQLQGHTTFQRSTSEGHAVAKKIHTERPRLDANAVTLLRAMTEVRGAFRDYEVWTKAAFAGRAEAKESVLMDRKEVKKGLDTMAAVERDVTYHLLQTANTCSLQADGLERIYQVEMGMVVWKIPKVCPWLHQLGTHAPPWLEQLGERGPWVVHRLLSAREIPAEMSTAHKADFVAESVRRACAPVGGSLAVDLHKSVCSRILSWSSDGGDRAVGDTATSHFPNMVFREWEESHSAVKLLEHAVKNHAESQMIDGLLVSGAAGAPRLNKSSKNPSLAKFLSTSLVFRKRCSEAQREEGLALCRNFGWAPQRYVSRAKPMSLTQRRWGPIWDSLEQEAGGTNERAALARYFIAELGGENSGRLLFGGMLTDIAVEHYKWVAGGDKGHPDPATVMRGTNLFLERLRVLIDEGMVVTMKVSYTAEVLQFLRKGKTLHYKKGKTIQVQSCGLGRDSDAPMQAAVKHALLEARRLVALIRAHVPVYRSRASWLYVFAAFRLPSPLSWVTAARDTQAERAEIQNQIQEIHASLDRIREAAKLDKKANEELLQLLPRAEVHRDSGLSTKAAWGRASTEFPEYKIGRKLVDLFLLWRPNTGNLERRFRCMREHRPAERSRLADITVESLLSVDFAPTSGTLAAATQAATGQSAGSAETQGVQIYVKRVLSFHEQLHNAPHRRPQQFRKQRRDAGVAKHEAELTARQGKSGAPLSEAAHARKRAAAVDALVLTTPEARSEKRRLHPLGAAAAAASAEDAAVPTEIQEKINKRKRETAASYEQAETRATKARITAARQVIGAFVKAGVGLVEESDSAVAGVALMPDNKDQKTLQFLKERNFTIVFDAIEFANAVMAMRARAPSRGHLVIVPQGDRSDYAMAARLAAALLGTHMATAEDYCGARRNQGVRSGCQFQSSYNAKMKPMLELAVSPCITKEFPSAPALLRHIAERAGSRITFYREASALRKVFKKKLREQPQAWRTCRILSKQEERMEEKKKYQILHATSGEFLSLLQIAKPRDAAAPGSTAQIEYPSGKDPLVPSRSGIWKPRSSTQLVHPVQWIGRKHLNWTR